MIGLTRVVELALVAGLAALAVSVVASPAVASDGDIERAQELFNEGAELYLDGEYSAAIVRFRQANAYREHSLFHYNIAMAELHRGEVVDAAEAAREARVTEPALEPDNRANNDAIIAGAGVFTTGSNVAVELAPDEDAEPIAEPEDPEDTQPVAEPDQPTEPADPDSGVGTLGWTGVSALAVGLGSLGGAWYVDAQVSDHRQGLEEVAGELSQEQFNDQIDEMARWQTRGQVLLFSGLFLAATGGTLLTLDVLTASSADEAQSGGDAVEVTIAPTMSTSGAGLVVHW